MPRHKPASRPKLAGTPEPRRGVCRRCGCTDDHACHNPSEPDPTRACRWVDSRQTLCTYCQRGIEIPLEIPDSAEGWQELADAAVFAISLDAAGQYGLVTTRIEVDLDRCHDALLRAEALGYSPRSLAGQGGAR